MSDRKQGDRDDSLAGITLLCGMHNNYSSTRVLPVMSVFKDKNDIVQLILNGVI